MKKYLSILIFIMAFFSCSEDFLEKMPLSELTTGNFYKTKDDFNAAINAVYDPLQHTEMYSKGAFRWGAKTDEMYRAFDWYGYAYSPTNSASNTMWNDLYQGIFAANIFISKAELSELEDDFLDPLIGEAYFLRGFYYFHLVRWFGGVPILTEPVNAETNLQLPRNTSDEVYAQIISDFEMAIIKLPLKSEYSSSELGKATKGAAQTLLANMYLYRAAPGDLQKVVDLTTSVMQSNEYDLEPQFADLFSLDHENGIESIFEVQFQTGSPYHDGNEINTWITKWNSTTVQPSFINEWDSNDIRKDVSVIMPGETVNNYTNNTEFCHQGKMVVGLSGPGSPAGTSDLDSPLNFKVERYANVLLMNAEARNELDSSPATEIINNVNRLRQRAGLDDLPLDMSKDDFRMAIREERKYELALECFRWFDLLRYERQSYGGGVTDVLANPASSAYNSAVKLPKHYLMPIPQVEIDNDPLLEQNPGY